MIYRVIRAFFTKNNNVLESLVESIDNGSLTLDKAKHIVKDWIYRAKGSGDVRDYAETVALFYHTGLATEQQLTEAIDNYSLRNSDHYKMWANLVPEAIVHKVLMQKIEHSPSSYEYFNEVLSKEDKLNLVNHIVKDNISSIDVIESLLENKDDIYKIIEENLSRIPSSRLTERFLGHLDQKRLVKILLDGAKREKPLLRKLIESDLVDTSVKEKILSKEFSERKSDPIDLSQYDLHPGERDRSKPSVKRNPILSREDLDDVTKLHNIEVDRKTFSGIYSYTTNRSLGGHIDVNKGLKFESLSDAAQHTVKSLDLAIKKSETKTPLTLWRGLSSSSSIGSVFRKFKSLKVSPYDIDIKQSDLNKMVGFTFKDPAFFSTSLSRDIAFGFASSGLVLRIKLPIGSNALFMNAVTSGEKSVASNYAHEHEVLLDRNLEFRISSVKAIKINNWGDNKIIIDLQIIS